MGQPTPPGDMPLIEGLGPEWNDIVSAFPEDRRAELGPKLKERVTGLTSTYEPLKQWEDLHKSGITPEQAGSALDIVTTIENNPQHVYDILGKYLQSQGLTPKEAKEAVEEIQEGETSEDPRIATMQQQLETVMQIMLAQRNSEVKSKLDAEAEAEIDRDLAGLRKKYGEFDENEILMRMAYRDMTPEQAYQDYTTMVSNIRKTRPAPMLLGNGGTIPRNDIDVKKLNPTDTKNLVAQMMSNALHERNK